MVDLPQVAAMNAVRIFVVSGFVFAATAAACSSKPDLPPTLGQGPPTPQPGGAGGLKNDASVDGAVDGATCTMIANTAPVVTETSVGEQFPQPFGGAIAGGTYALTAAYVYTGIGGNAGPTGREFQETMTLDPSRNAFADATIQGTADAGLGAPTFSDGTFTVIGNSIIFNAVCPATGSTTASYSVIGTTLHLYEAQQFELVFTPQ